MRVPVRRRMCVFFVCVLASGHICLCMSMRPGMYVFTCSACIYVRMCGNVHVSIYVWMCMHPCPHSVASVVQPGFIMCSVLATLIDHPSKRHPSWLTASAAEFPVAFSLKT